MKHRTLRIAWSVGWGVVAVLLCVLWARSYFGLSTFEVLVTRTHRHYLFSTNGATGILRAVRVFAGFEIANRYLDGYFADLNTHSGLKFVRDSAGSFRVLLISYWLLVPGAVCAATLPWLRWRFGLRTLLIGTTLVAMLLGLIGAFH